MFGYVIANWKELDNLQRERYGSVYCGICRSIHDRCGQLPRLVLRYDMAFLALLLMSLYEPEETAGAKHCPAHPGKKRPWVENPCVRYAGDMNVALAYYKALDDWHDDHSPTGKILASALEKHQPGIRQRFPRQCEAMERCIRELSRLEGEGCPNPDTVANCFGSLMGELFVYSEDLWAPYLRELGHALGRFIYLLDAAVDYDSDKRKGKYNPFLAMGMEKDWHRWEEYLVLAMAKCTHSYEMLPLVQDKGLLDNILYSGVWVGYRAKGKEGKAHE